MLRAIWLCMMTGCLLGIIVGTAPFPRRERRGLRLSLLTRECVCAAGVLVGEGRLPVRNFQLHSFIFQVHPPHLGLGLGLRQPPPGVTRRH